MSIGTLNIKPTKGYGFDLKTGKSGFTAKVLASLLLWQERASMRAQLAQLDEENLIDMGISRQDARTEARKPFWRA
ncbi:DUF1127 domain-containing protein [Sneathiella chinensis]|uniref:YjiS-like domain-containing protein n=1 Tax=Sneathiella chinensis TaxID=349750 RepID=A0ABQ5U3F6_9PROT|nr:DUF1127 domain-containing protein [Sneathiella chinensis]GLQ06256.1 hypothetical protein GCM10007924_14770 [Sneathiella chinensis]